MNVLLDPNSIFSLVLMLGFRLPIFMFRLFSFSLTSLSPTLKFHCILALLYIFLLSACFFFVSSAISSSTTFSDSIFFSFFFCFVFHLYTFFFFLSTFFFFFQCFHPRASFFIWPVSLFYILLSTFFFFHKSPLLSSLFFYLHYFIYMFSVFSLQCIFFPLFPFLCFVALNFFSFTSSYTPSLLTLSNAYVSSDSLLSTSFTCNFLLLSFLPSLPTSSKLLEYTRWGSESMLRLKAS